MGLLAAVMLRVCLAAGSGMELMVLGAGVVSTASPLVVALAGLFGVLGIASVRCRRGCAAAATGSGCAAESDALLVLGLAALQLQLWLVALLLPLVALLLWLVALLLFPLLGWGQGVLA